MVFVGKTCARMSTGRVGVSSRTQHTAFSGAWSSGAADLDVTFAQLRSDIQTRLTILDKRLKLKLTAWLAKLAEESHGQIWKRNRNSYAKLLLAQLKFGRIEEPFDAMPPTTRLPMLPKALMYTYSQTPRSKEHSPGSTPSQQLDRYLASQNLSLVSSHNTTHMAGEGHTSAHSSGQSGQKTIEFDVSSESASPHDWIRWKGEVLGAPLRSNLPPTARNVETDREPAFATTNRPRYDENRIAEVLYRAERRNNSGSEKQPGALARHFPMASVLSDTRVNKDNSEHHVRGDNEPLKDNWSSRKQHERRNVADLESSLGRFRLRTAELRAHVYRAQDLESVHASSGVDRRHAFPAEKRLNDPEEEFFSKGLNAHNCIGLPIRQTLKSSAAAAARRNARDAACQPKLTCASTRSPLEVLHSHGGSHVEPARSKRLAQLLRPRPGSTAGLVSEVSTLRRRLEASVAALEGDLYEATGNAFRKGHGESSIMSTPEDGYLALPPGEDSDIDRGVLYKTEFSGISESSGGSMPLHAACASPLESPEGVSLAALRKGSFSYWGGGGGLIDG